MVGNHSCKMACASQSCLPLLCVRKRTPYSSTISTAHTYNSLRHSQPTHPQFGIPHIPHYRHIHTMSHINHLSQPATFLQAKRSSATHTMEDTGTRQHTKTVRACTQFQSFPTSCTICPHSTHLPSYPHCHHAKHTTCSSHSPHPYQFFTMQAKRSKKEE